MPIINILFWSTLGLAAYVLWKLYVYMAAMEEEAERQYQLLIMEEHMCDMRAQVEAVSPTRNNLHTPVLNSSASGNHYAPGRKYPGRSRRHNDNRKSRHNRGYRIVA